MTHSSKCQSLANWAIYPAWLHLGILNMKNKIKRLKSNRAIKTTKTARFISCLFIKLTGKETRSNKEEREYKSIKNTSRLLETLDFFKTFPQKPTQVQDGRVIWLQTCKPTHGQGQFHVSFFKLWPCKLEEVWSCILDISRVAKWPGWPRWSQFTLGASTVLIFHSQKCPGLDGKWYAHPNMSGLKWEARRWHPVDYNCHAETIVGHLLKILSNWWDI